MKNLFVGLFTIGALFLVSNTVFACNCNCASEAISKCNCQQTCDCGCQKGEKCNCEKCNTSECQKCNCKASCDCGCVTRKFKFLNRNKSSCLKSK